MLDTGEWGLPVLFDGRADLQKPPLYYWMVAAVGWVNGGVVTEWVARFPAALAGLACVLLVYAFLRAEGRPTAAIVAALALVTANHFTGISRIGVRHRDIDLNPMWYVAGYTRLKLAFIEVILKSDLHVVTKGQFVKTLDKYIAIDMALALSAYDAVILD